MNTKDFFLKTLKDERQKFRDAIEALPEDMHGHKVHDRSREAGSLASQLAMQCGAISAILTKGTMGDDSHMPTKMSKSEMLAMFDKTFAQLEKDVAEISEDKWENETAALVFPGGKWEDKKYNMAWGFLFDAIHHRGQLSTFLRAMGAKVPSIYGPSADTK